MLKVLLMKTSEWACWFSSQGSLSAATVFLLIVM
jgi:hypothetical protein